MTGDKHNKTMDDFMRDLCPALSIRQLYRISTIFSDDKCKTDTVNDQVSLRGPVGLMLAAQ